MTLDTLTEKKAHLDSFGPLPSELIINLEEWFRVELTYTSNAIEGNTLTRQETAVVLDKGVTIGGKSIVEHLEATHHSQAWSWVSQAIQQGESPYSEEFILTIHKVILQGIDDQVAGRYRHIPVRISGSQVVLPNPIKVPELMKNFAIKMNKLLSEHPVIVAAQSHYELVSIHPFVDGNGRTARLLMNAILLKAGYPPAVIQPDTRLEYLKSLETAQMGGSLDSFYDIVMNAVDQSLDMYIEAAENIVTD